MKYKKTLMSLVGAALLGAGFIGGYSIGEKKGIDETLEDSKPQYVMTRNELDDKMMFVYSKNRKEGIVLWNLENNYYSEKEGFSVYYRPDIKDDASAWRNMYNDIHKYELYFREWHESQESVAKE